MGTKFASVLARGAWAAVGLAPRLDDWSTAALSLSPSRLCQEISSVARRRLSPSMKMRNA